MLCDRCHKREATVHMTKIINDEKTEAHLCEVCAREQGEDLFFEPSFTFQNLLAGLLDPEAAPPSAEPRLQRPRTRCPNCGLSFADFRRLGHLGCSVCYEEFDRQLEPVFRRIHGSAAHRGKVPSRSGRVHVRAELERLQAELERAVAREEYERAAQLRDQIRSLEKEAGREGREVSPYFSKPSAEGGAAVALRDILTRTLGEWMKGTGPERDIAIGSRVRLARNVAGIAFPGVAGEEQLRRVLERVRAARQADPELRKLEFFPMSEISPLERQLLVERHLVSPQHTRDVERKAVLLRADESVSVMVNEEDHLRIQVLVPGMEPAAAWRLGSQLDDAFERHLEYAFSERRGYLTAWPTNVGTGLRASVMVHLPALTMTEQMKRVIGAINKFGVVVRGLYGEGTEALGNIYQLSNQVSLGHTEAEIVEHLLRVARHVIDQERQARQHVLSRGKLALEDRTWRSYGLLANARQISTQEAMQLLSDVRLGIDLGILQGLEPRILQELLVMIRPAHLQRLVGRELEPRERDVHRAALIRERLRGGGARGL